MLRWSIFLAIALFALGECFTKQAAMDAAYGRYAWWCNVGGGVFVFLLVVTVASRLACKAYAEQMWAVMEEDVRAQVVKDAIADAKEAYCAGQEREKTQAGEFPKSNGAEE